MKQTTLYTTLLILALLLAEGCDYNSFDNPPRDEAVVLTPTHTLAQLKALYTQGGRLLTQDIVVAGTVVSSDREGNIYKALMIQDNTGGIELKIGRTGIYNFYKIGQTLYVKCRGLVLGAYGKSLDLGTAPVKPGYETDFINTLQVEDYLFKGAMGACPDPVVISLSGSIPARLDNMRVRLENVQFKKSELLLTYADSKNKITQNRSLEDAGGNTIIVRTSGYARFAGTQLPQGAGSVEALLSFYNGTPQLYIVSLADVKLDGPRIR